MFLSGVRSPLPSSATLGPARTRGKRGAPERWHIQMFAEKEEGRATGFPFGAFLLPGYVITQTRGVYETKHALPWGWEAACDRRWGRWCGGGFFHSRRYRRWGRRKDTGAWGSCIIRVTLQRESQAVCLGLSHSLARAHWDSSVSLPTLMLYTSPYWLCSDAAQRSSSPPVVTAPHLQHGTACVWVRGRDIHNALGSPLASSLPAFVLRFPADFWLGKRLSD